MAATRSILATVPGNLDGVHAMARKRAKKMSPTVVEHEVKRVRLDLPPADYERLQRAAKSKGLNKASFARMAVLELIKAVEAEGGGK
jgi:hypothetical protein